MVNFFKKRKHEAILSLLIIVYIAYFITASFLRHDNFYTGRFDLGNMVQTVWNTTQGRIFEVTYSENLKNSSRLGTHADVILVLLAPIYALFPHPYTLLAIQTIAIGLGAIFIYLLGIKILNHKTLSLTIAFAYLMYPSLEYVNLYDFHPVSLAIPFLLGAFYFLIIQKYNHMLIFLILAALTKEQLWAILALFGGYIFWFHKKKVLGSILFLVSCFIFYYIFWQVIPNAREGSQHFALEFYADFGSTPGEVIKNIIFNPVKTFSLFFEESRVDYLKKLFLPLGFTSLAWPFVLIFAAPDFLINILGTNMQFRQIYYQYTANIIPFVFISAMYGIRYLQTIIKKIPQWIFIWYILLSTLYSAYQFGPLPGAKSPNIDMFTRPQKDKLYIKKALLQIPKNKKVAATNNLGAHLSHREFIFTIPDGVYQADYVVFLLGDIFAQPSPQAQKGMVEELKKNKQYKILAEKNDFILFKKLSRFYF